MRGGIMADGDAGYPTYLGTEIGSSSASDEAGIRFRFNIGDAVSGYFLYGAGRLSSAMVPIKATSTNPDGTKMANLFFTFSSGNAGALANDYHVACACTFPDGTARMSAEADGVAIDLARRALADSGSTEEQRAAAEILIVLWDEYQDKLRKDTDMTAATRNLHLVDDPAPDSQAVENVHIDNLNAGGAAAGSVDTQAMKDGAVTSAKIAPGAVNTAAIGDGQVTGAKLADATVTTAKLAEGVIPEAPTTIPTGALVPGAGIDLTRGEGEVLTCAVKAKGVTAAMLADGVIPDPYTLPAASTTAIGGVKKAAAVPVVASADAAQAAGEAPTKAEFDALAALANENKKQLNALIAAGKAAGFLA